MNAPAEILIKDARVILFLPVALITGLAPKIDVSYIKKPLGYVSVSSSACDRYFILMLGKYMSHRLPLFDVGGEKSVQNGQLLVCQVDALPCF